MEVFITGASGHLGSAVIPELVAAGHRVVGLARSEESARALESLGARARRGSLDDLDTLAEAATAADGVIHLAFKHDEMQAGNMEAAVDADLGALRALGEALAGTDKPLVGTSGTLMLVAGGVSGVGTEDDVLPGGPRIDAENYVIGLAGRGVRSSVVRLPPTVHSSLDHRGFVPGLIALARGNQRSGYVGEGENRWPAVHTLDAAHLYRLALEEAPAGTRLHAVADEGVAFRSIAESIGRHLDVPAVSIEPAEVADFFTYLAFAVPLDNPASSERTRRLLGWEPTRPGLLDDLDLDHYYREERA